MTDWIDNELRHDGALDEPAPSAEEQAKIDAEATAAAENAERVFAAQDAERAAQESDAIKDAFARLAEVHTISLRRQDWNTISRTLGEKEAKLRKGIHKIGNKSASTIAMHKRQADELAVLIEQIKTWIEINEKTTGPLTKA